MFAAIAPIIPKQLNPPLKWAGGKRWLLPEITKLWEGHTREVLVEPFAGGLAIALGLRSTWATLNDINSHLINFYRQIQDGLTVTIEMVNSHDSYYQARDRFNHLIRIGQAETSEAAQLFYYLNRTGYNGLCRFNRKDEFNVPFGKYKKINYAQNFDEYTVAFRNWVFCSGDFEDLYLSDSAFIYADPPYDVEFTSYSAQNFRWEDQVRLVNWLVKHSGPVVTTNQATPRIIELYQKHGFDIRILDAPRRISCNGDRTPAKEMLATRNFKMLKLYSFDIFTKKTP